jgi:creatinine amidohydrolase
VSGNGGTASQAEAQVVEARRDELQIERLSWAEIRDRVDAGMDRVICLVGSIEQHGPHLPCETDCYYGLAMATRAARRLGETLVAPVIRPGCSQHHLGFPGTVSVTPEVLVAVVSAQLQCLIDAGFRRVVLTSSHGGNFVPLSESLEVFQRICAEGGAELTPVLDLLAWIDALKAAPNRHGLRQEDMPAVQGDLIETSIMMALHPEMVRTDRIERGFVGDFDLEGSFAERGLIALTSNGILGDPTAATPELGEEILEEIEQYLLDAVMGVTGDDVRTAV